MIDPMLSYQTRGIISSENRGQSSQNYDGINVSNIPSWGSSTCIRASNHLRTLSSSTLQYMTQKGPSAPSTEARIPTPTCLRAPRSAIHHLSNKSSTKSNFHLQPIRSYTMASERSVAFIGCGKCPTPAMQAN